MAVLNISALMIYRLFGGFGPFHAFAVVSLVTVGLGVATAVRRRDADWVERHYMWVTYSYVGLLAAAASEISTRWVQTKFWWAVLIATAAVFAIGSTWIR